MSNGNDKFNMFENFEVNINDNEDSHVYGEEEVEIVSVTMKTGTPKKFAQATIARSQEEYETYIESTYFETHIHPESGEAYQVKVTVLKPEINPQELLRPAYAYSTNH